MTDIPNRLQDGISTEALLDYMDGGPDPYSEEKHHTRPSPTMNLASRPTRFWTLSVFSGAAVLIYLFATAPD